MSDFTPRENSVSVRNPATANFLIDSTDRVGFSGGTNAPYGQTSANFLINKNNSLLNGFFTRLAVSEVYVDYCIDNVSAYYGNNTFTIKNNGSTITAVLPDYSYTTAQALTSVATGLNLGLNGQGYTCIASTTTGFLPNTGQASLYFYSTGTLTTKSVFVSTTTLARQLDMAVEQSGNMFPSACAKVLPITYLDFVCPEATQNQDIKDSSTSLTDRNMLYRWHLAWDGPPPLDGFGYPIFQGQTRFISRRALPFPKHIRWSANQPIGQMAFQVYDSTGNLVPVPDIVGNVGPAEFEWAMTLLVSEN